MKSVAAAVVLIGFALFSANVKRQLLHASAAPDVLAALPVDGTMADFTLPDRAGQPVNLERTIAANRATIVNFWGSWCGLCRFEMPAFERMYTRSSGRGLAILAVDESDQRAALDSYLASRPLSFPVLIDSGGSLARRLGIRAFPTSVLLDGRGRIIRVIEGVEPDLVTSVSMMLAADGGKE